MTFVLAASFILCPALQSTDLLLLILQELLVLVVLDLLDLLQLMELTLLLEAELLLLRLLLLRLLLLRLRLGLLLLRLLLLGQVLGGCLSVKALGRAPHDVGAGGWRGHAGGLVVDWLPGVGGGEAVQALGDVGVGPHVCRGVVQYLVWRSYSQVFKLKSLSLYMSAISYMTSTATFTASD